MDYPFPKETQSLLSPSGDAKKRDWVRWNAEKNIQIPQCSIEHNRVYSDPTGHYQTQQNIAEHRRAQSDPTEYNWTQQDKARHNRAQSDTEGHNLIHLDIVEKKGKEILEERTTSEENNEPLKQLEAKYLLCGPLIYREDSQIEYIIDGVDYFRCVHELIQSTKKGDAIWISKLSLDPHFDLLNKPQGDPHYQELGDLLTEKAADGVDVRILLASGLVTGSLPYFNRLAFRPLRRNTFTAMDLRTRIPKTRNVTEAPLARRVALDWTGALLGANHQKFVLVCHQGKLTALVTGLDFRETRYDQYPHDTLRLRKKRWGWHDASVLITGPITENIWEYFRLRWQEVSTLPKRSVRGSGLTFIPANTHKSEELPKAPKQESIANPGVSMQTLRSFGKWKIDSQLPAFRKPWSLLPREGVKEIYQCLTKALGSARQYIYIEDQYLRERMGGKSDYEIYPFLVKAAQRNVKVILLGSGRRLFFGPRVTISVDIQKKVLDRLAPEEQRNIVISQVEHLTTHSKVILIDDEFASVGSANLFSRSMSGVDHELNVAVVTTGTQVRDLRVKLWAEHLRSPLGQDLIHALRDLGDQGLAFGIWRPEWLPQTADRQNWRKRGLPKGFEPREQVLKFVGPE